MLKEDSLTQQAIKKNTLDALAMRRIQCIHFVGIGGAGMGGIAEVLLNQGFHITGSDQNSNALTKRLASLGAIVFGHHDKEHVMGADVVVASTAISKDNPELVQAYESRIPVVPRAEMLAELMRFRFGIAVAGTHGKTTTTSLLASILAQGGLDPTFMIGGLLNSAGTNAKLGLSDYLVAEADESDGSFLFLSPMVAIITNIDKDHLSSYQNDFEILKNTFIDFVHRLPFYGRVIVCIDCPVIKELIPRIGRPILTYGFSPEADFCIQDFQQTEMRSHFSIHSSRLDKPVVCELNLAGQHNALNATAAFISALEEGIDIVSIQKALSDFAGIGRRFQMFARVPFEGGSTFFIDDYGHHPAELKATIRAARQAWPDRKFVMAFQPHRYSRTHDLFEDFVEVLSSVDQLFLLEVYGAGEKPIVGADGRALCGAIRQRGQIEPIFVPTVSELSTLLLPHLNGQEVVLIQGAGDIGKYSSDFQIDSFLDSKAG